MHAPTIRIRGARTHNLRSIDIDIPRGRLVVFAGLSGAGKSSLVFDTIAAEAGYQLAETFPPFARNRLPKWTRPSVDAISGVSPVVVIDQKRLGGNARSTVGTATDTWTYLRLLYSRLSTPYVGESTAFSFNDPSGMCPTCAGLGEVVTSAVDRFIDEDRSLADGAIRVPGFGFGGYFSRQYADIAGFDVHTPLREWPEDERRALLYGAKEGAGRRLPDDYEGIVPRFERIHLHTSDDVSERKAAVIREFTRSSTCPDCAGERLNEAARTAIVHGRTIAELARMEVSELVEVVREFDEPETAPAAAALVQRLEALVDIGLGYLHLARATPTLSGGESQRIKTVRHLGSSLTEMLYVFDEPTVGLHPADVDAMITLLRALRDKGNTVLVVEHDPAVMAAADEIVEIGPAAGEAGGRLVFQGPFDELRRADTATGAALRAPLPPSPAPRRVTDVVEVRGATRNNLRDVSVDIPRGMLTVLTGVAGSGKSSLAAELISQHEASVIDQRPLAANRRSTPITYTGIAAQIRKVFAEAHGVSPSQFSANSEGGCPACGGLGVRYTDLAFMDGQETPCETCGGRRFRPEVCELTVDGLSIADVDDLTVAEAVTRLPSDHIRRALGHLHGIGLGYLRLGQPLNTLSGGESQRVKIAAALRDATSPGIYVLDEPTTGLHASDIDTLLGLLTALRDRGHTVVVIEHNLRVIRQADWVIDLGPGAGRHGGRVLYEGRVDAIAGTPTARALAAEEGAWRRRQLTA